MQEKSDADEEPRFLVRVFGFASKTTKDGLLNFFENTRRSGGGDIKDIQLNQNEGFADIIFWSDQDAERIMQNNSLELDGAKLITVLKTLPKELPVDQRRLYVVNINDKTTMDSLKSFMEVASGGEVENILFGSNSDCMVSFQEPVDFHKVQKMCTINSLDDNFLTIEEVKICECIEVSGLAPNTTRDAIFCHFRNQRNGGGDVKSCEVIDVCKQRMVISFEDPKVIECIMKQDHMVDGTSLTVRRYYPFLGETSLTNPAGAEKYNAVIIDPQTMLFIKEFISQEFDQLLHDHRVNYTWEPGSGEIVLGRAEPKIDKKTWENSCEAVVAYIDQIVTEKIYISRETWEQTSDEVKAKCAVYESQISMQHVFDFQTKENLINLRGKKPDVCDLAKQLQDLVYPIEERIKIEKSKITKKIELSAVQMELMSCSGLLDDIKTQHEGLEMTVINNSNDKVIQLRGLEEEVDECAAFVWQSLSKVKESEMKFSKSVISILGSEKGKAFIATSLKENSIEAIISFDSSSDTHLMVTAMDRDQMNKAMEFIKSAIAEESIHLHLDQKQVVAIEEEEWKEFMHSMQQSMLLQVTEEPATSKLLLVGIKEEVDMAKERVGKFFQDNVLSNRENAVKVDVIKMKFINKFLSQEFNKLLQECRVKHTWRQGSGEMVLGCADHKMNKKTWEKSCKAVVAYIDQIVTEKITVTQEAWEDMYARAREKRKSFRDQQVALTCKEQERSFTLTGKKPHVSVLAQQLNDLNSKIQKRIEFEKNKVSRIISLTQAQLELLRFSGFVDDLRARRKDLEVKLLKDDRAIELTGLDAVVKEASITVWETLSRLKETDVELPKSIVSIVGSQAGKIFMSTKFKKEHIDAVVNGNPNADNHLVVTALDRNDARKAVDLIEELTSEQSIRVNDLQELFINMVPFMKWRQIKQSIEQSMLLQIREEPSASKLWIAGIKEEVDKAKKKVDIFFKENIILVIVLVMLMFT